MRASLVSTSTKLTSDPHTLATSKNGFRPNAGVVFHPNAGVVFLCPLHVDYLQHAFCGGFWHKEIYIWILFSLGRIRLLGPDLIVLEFLIVVDTVVEIVNYIVKDMNPPSVRGALPDCTGQRIKGHPLIIRLHWLEN